MLALAVVLGTPVAAGADGFMGGPLPAAPGSGLAKNNSTEATIAASPDGDFWATAFALPADRRVVRPVRGGPILGAQDMWRSSDGGVSYDWVAAPFELTAGGPGIGSVDSDIAVASEPNREGHHNVYAASMVFVGEIPSLLTEVALAVSPDGGRTWLVDPAAATVPLDDRPWLVADGACTVYLVYHALPTVATVVNKYDLCDVIESAQGLTTVPLASTRYVELLPQAATNQEARYVFVGFGKPAVDTSARSPFRHRLYIPAVDCEELSVTREVQRGLEGPDCPGNTVVYVQLSADGGKSWSVRRVATNSNNEVALWPVSIATGDDGSVYIAWFDNHDAYLSSSPDGGSTWTAARRINEPEVATAAYPTVAAGADGVVKVAWYGTAREGNANDAEVMGQPNAPDAAEWRVYLASSGDGGGSFTIETASDVVHTGAVCTRGAGCDASSNTRNLFENFGVALSPRTGRASIVYNSDQPGGTFPADIFVSSSTEEAP